MTYFKSVLIGLGTVLVGCMVAPIALCNLGELDDQEKWDRSGVHWIQPDSDNALDGLLGLHHRVVHCRICAVRIVSEEVNAAVLAGWSAIQKFRSRSHETSAMRVIREPKSWQRVRDFARAKQRGKGGGPE